jgi:TRAP-type mannitol/chloroaromatic compound transport system substrate-binding protein
VARNNNAQVTLVNEHEVDVRRLPDEVLTRLRELSDEVVAEIADKNPEARKIYDSFSTFREQVMAWTDISERAYLNSRGS